MAKPLVSGLVMLWAVLGGLAAVAQGGLTVWVYTHPEGLLPDHFLDRLNGRVPGAVEVEIFKGGAVLVLGAGLILAALLQGHTGRSYMRMYPLPCAAVHICYVVYEFAVVSPAVAELSGTQANGAVGAGVVLAAGGFIFHSLVLWAMVSASTPEAAPPAGANPPRPRAPHPDVPISSGTSEGW